MFNIVIGILPAIGSMFAGLLIPFTVGQYLLMLNNYVPVFNLIALITTILAINTALFSIRTVTRIFFGARRF